MSKRRTVARLLAPTATLGLIVLGLAGPASAHVTITPDTTAAGAYAILTASVPHGCDASATTKVVISIPEEILSITPTRNPLWKVTKTREKLDEPITDAHGNEVTERDATVAYTAKAPLPDGYRDAFELSLQLPEEEGVELAFPTIQTCEKGRTDWVEVATDGQDPEELEHPAPLVITTAAVADAHVPASTDEAAEAESAEVESTRESAAKADGGTDTLGALGLGAGVLGLLAGGTALVMARRKP